MEKKTFQFGQRVAAPTVEPAKPAARAFSFGKPAVKPVDMPESVDAFLQQQAMAQKPEAAKRFSFGQRLTPHIADTVQAKINVDNTAKMLQKADNEEPKEIRALQPQDILPPAKELPPVKDDNYGLPPHIKLDPTQEAAIQGMLKQQFSCLTGAAGTGKTTIERALLWKLERLVNKIDVANYGKQNPDMEAEREERNAIALCAFTGMAVQQQQRAVPQKYSSMCFTIHRLLGFHPEFFDEEDEEGNPKTVKRFVPLYTAAFKMPWETIIMDEGSMVPIDLWNMFFDALRPDCRVYIIGDLNQLPPVHGQSVFGYALQKWPSFELSVIHRQKGVDNPIVDNAWRILRGEFPKAVPGRFDMFPLPNKSDGMMPTELLQQNFIIKVARTLQIKEIFQVKASDERKSDMIIVAQNKSDIGQWEINNRLIPYFNAPPPSDSMQVEGARITIVAGTQKVMFAVGDKVMNTKNDYELGVTNGMTGVVTAITINGNFRGKHADHRVSASLANDLMAQLENGSLSLDEIDHTEEDDEENEILAVEAAKRQASHIIQVDFGYNDDGEKIVIDFRTSGHVLALQLAWAATCHKCQGSEYPVVVIVCSNKNWRMMNREWLYTAVTRASQRVVLLYDDRGISRALSTQKIKGKTLKEKAQAFLDAQQEVAEGRSDRKLPNLPEPKEMEN